MTRRWLLVLVTGALLAGAAPLTAQVHWESPLVLPPRDEPAFGIYLIDASRAHHLRKIRLLEA
jgi:hypothetical protein